MCPFGQFVVFTLVIIDANVSVSPINKGDRDYDLQVGQYTSIEFFKGNSSISSNNLKDHR